MIVPGKFQFNTDLYCITGEEFSLGRSNVDVVKAMIAGGIKIIQYREKDKCMKEKYEECRVIRTLTKEAGVTFIVNDDIALAMVVGADGVHIGQGDLPADKVRQLVGPEMIIGLSTHAPAEAQEAVRLGVDYIGVGPIFKTATKKDVCDPVGLEYLEYVAQHIHLPFVAIGGIKRGNVQEVLKRGAGCVAIITDITTAEDIPGRIAEFNQAMQQYKNEERV